MTKKHYIIPIFVPHEGCPHNCVFCNQDSITGNSAQIDSNFVKNTIDEYLETIKKENSIIEVSFFGGTFTAIDINKQNSLLETAMHYKSEGKIDYIRLSTRPDYIDDRILTNLKNNSVDIIELGVQSLDQEVLYKSGRGHTEEDVKNASMLIKRYGFVLGHQIMLGLPGDTFEKDIETTKKVIKLAPDICRIYPSLVIKDTPMEKLYERGLYKPYTLKEAVDICKIVYGMLVANGINVIRVGLQTTEEINIDGDVIAGPFHPSFRELVEGRIYNDLILDSLSHKHNEEVTILINPKDVSKLYCNKKLFFNDTKEQLKTINIKVIQDDAINRNYLTLQTGDICNLLSIYEYFEKKYKEGYSDIL